MNRALRLVSTALLASSSALAQAPLSGTVYSPSVPGATDTAPDVASDRFRDNYLVVFERAEASRADAVWGVAMRSDGTPEGAPFRIGDGNNPKVGNVETTGEFVVAYRRGNRVYARAVWPRGSSVSSEVLLATAVASIEVLDVGSAGQLSQVPVLCREFGTSPGSRSDVWAKSVRVLGGGSPPQVGPVFFAPAGTPAGRLNGHEFLDARLAEHSGRPGKYVVLYNEYPTSGGFAPGLLAALVDLGGGQAWEQTVPGVALPDQLAVAGQGPEFLLASSGQAVRAFVVDNDFAFEPARPLATADSIARSGSSYLAATRSGGTGGLGPSVTSINPATCTPCEGVFSLPGVGGSTRSAIAAGPERLRRAEHALVAWPDSARTISIAAFRVEDGIVTSVRGGCGEGGEAVVSCARVGSAVFSQELRGAAASAPAWLLFGASSFYFACGPCILRVSPAGAVVLFAGTTDANGRASAALSVPPVPALVGLKLYEQWLVAASGGCSSFGIAFSNGLEVELQ